MTNIKHNKTYDMVQFGNVYVTNESLMNYFIKEIQSGVDPVKSTLNTLEFYSNSGVTTEDYGLVGSYLRKYILDHIQQETSLDQQTIDKIVKTLSGKPPIVVIHHNNFNE
jgi:hypothetical protein